MSSDPVVPVVQIHYRSPDWCVSSAQAISSSANVEVALVIVDNSGDLPTDSERLPTGAEVLGSGSNVGYAGGANLGLLRALSEFPDAPHVAVCSHDFHPTVDCLELLVEALRHDPELGIVAPRLISPQRSIGWMWDGRRATNIEPHNEMSGVLECDWVSGTFMLVRSECLRQVGGLDEGFESYVEDVDLCLRVRDAGWRVGTVIAAEGHGLGSVSSVRFRKKAINVVLLAAKRDGLAAVSALLGLYLGRVVVSAVRVVVPSRRGLRRRADDAARACTHASALWFLVRSELIGVYRRDPHRFEPAFDDAKIEVRS